MPTRARAFLGLVIAASCLAQTPVPVEKETVSGTVTNASGEPLRRVSLQLIPVMPARGSTPDAPAQNAATETDLQGNFNFNEISPGRYFLTAQRAGYLPASYYNARGRVLTVDTGQKATGILIKMTPYGIVGGRVVDEEREPVPGATVKVSFYFTSGQREPTAQIVSTGTTDADGAFAIGGLTPGKYVVAVASPPNTGPPITSAPQRGPQEVYVDTYYPDATDLAAATPVELAAGAQARGLEIRLHKIPVFKVSGRVVNTVTGEPGSAVLTLFRRGNLPGLSARSAGVSAGDFSFDGVSPGTYVLETKSISEAEDRPPLAAWQVISVGSSDLDRVVVEMKPGVEVRGNIIVEGAPPSSWPKVTLTPEEGLNYPTDFATVDGNGRFTVTGLEPAPYRVNVSLIPALMFLKGVRFNGRDIGNEPMDLSAARTASLEIVISDKSASINGVVNDSAGPVGAGIVVMALSRSSESTLLRRLTDDSGRFSLKGLPPGEYILTAMDTGTGFPQIAPGRIDKVGKTVTLGESASETVELRLTTMEDLRVDLR